MGKPLEAHLATGYPEAHVYALYDGIPVLNYCAIAENYYACDERVNLGSRERTPTVIAQFIAEWCGVEQLGHARV